MTTLCMFKLAQVPVSPPINDPVLIRGKINVILTVVDYWELRGREVGGGGGVAITGPCAPVCINKAIKRLIKQHENTH